MQNIKTCKHGVPMFITCTACRMEKEAELLPADHPKCKHGNPEGYCELCMTDERINAQAEKDREQKEKEEVQRKYKYEHPDIETCNIPKKYKGCMLDMFRGNDKLVRACREYNNGGLVLYGNTGCGKTHLAVSLMREKARVSTKKLWFETAPDLLLTIRSSFRDGAAASEAQIVDCYSTIPFLVLDDLGSEKATEFAITTLYIILDRRDRELLDTIITTNLSLAEIGDRLSARIASRLSGMKNIKINMPDYRKKR